MEAFLTENTEPEKKDENYVSSFEEMFDSYGEGWTLSVYRESPKDLSGFLEEIELEPGENPVNLQYLIQNWGGKVLRLMLRDNKGVFRRRMLIQLKSFPPRVNGKLVYEIENIQKKDSKTELLEYFALLKEIRPEQPPQNNNNLAVLLPLVAPFIKAIAEKMLMPPVSIPSQAASITEMMAALSTMREFVQPPGENSDMGASLISLAEKALPLIAQKQSQSQPHPQPRHVPIVPAVTAVPAHVAHPVLTPIPNPDSPPAPAMPEMPDEVALMQILQKKLLDGDISGAALTNLYFDTVARLSDNEKAEAERVLENALGLEPIDETEDDPPQISRRNVGPNSGNDTPDRSGDKTKR